MVHPTGAVAGRTRPVYRNLGVEHILSEAFSSFNIRGESRRYFNVSKAFVSV